MSVPAFGIAGFKNSGKTTLVERLVKEMTSRGLRVSTVKHSHHRFDLDQPGRDTFRHREAGALEVAIVSSRRWAIMHELHDEEEPPLTEILGKLAPCDLVLVEGYKFDQLPKIEIRDIGLDHRELAGEDSNIVAIAASGHLDDTILPVFDRDDIGAVSDFILSHCGVRW